MFLFKKKFLNLVLILLVGGLGGVLADHFLMPYLASVPPFSNIKFIQRVGNGTTIINPTSEVVIVENTALENSIDKIGPRLVSIQSYQGIRLIAEGTGFIVTSDGLTVTANDLVPARATQVLVSRNNHSSSAEVIKRDLVNNLALIKIEENNLSVASFADLEELRLGQRVVLVGLESIENTLNRFVNLSIIKSISSSGLRVNLFEENAIANGGPLINIKGEVIGMNLVNQNGLVKVVLIDEIREFIDL